MKHHGCKVDYEKQRNDDLMRAYHELIEASDVVCLRRLHKEVVNMPSVRFWVSEERVAIVIAAMMKGDKLKWMRQTKREMFQEIYKRVMALRKRFPKRSLFSIACSVVMQPAPKFYITPSYAKQIYFQHSKKWYEERKPKTRRLC